MALKIRMRRQGARNRPFYRLVVTDIRTKRDGAYLENVGWYDPMAAQESNCLLKADRIRHWLSVGAIASDNVMNLVKRCAPELAADLRK